MTNTELRHIAKEALDVEYGFSPKLTDIRLLEANDNGLYILFSVKDSEYRFDSRYFPIGYGESRINTIWCGKGTVEKIK